MAIDMFLTLDDVEGESTDASHEGALDVLAFSWGVSSTATATGSRTSVAPDVQALSLTVYQSTASVPMTLAVVTGRRFTAAVLTVRTPGERPLDRWVMTMNDVVLTSLSCGGSGGEDRLTENVTLSFGRLAMRYTPQGSTGAAGPVVEGSFDVRSGKVVTS